MRGVLKLLKYWRKAQMPQTVKEYCAEVYANTYASEKERLTAEFLEISRYDELSSYKANEVETAAQKEAIKTATIEGIRAYNDVEAVLIWRAVYETHVHRKSGIDNAETINKVVAADQSWKKASGHAFEEMCKILGTAALQEHGIEIILQRDLNTLIKAGELDNEPRDISWLKEQVKASIFDLFAIINMKDKKYCFGCIQSKTSIRDRVTRDREPSMQAMRSFFWSTCIVLDGDFLKLPKFTHMVNGGTIEHEHNGWHGMYVFSDLYTGGRIYPIDLDFKSFKDHAVQAANYWLTQRQWFNSDWTAGV